MVAMDSVLLKTVRRSSTGKWERRGNRPLHRGGGGGKENWQPINCQWGGITHILHDVWRNRVNFMVTQPKPSSPSPQGINNQTGPLFYFFFFTCRFNSKLSPECESARLVAKRLQNSWWELSGMPKFDNDEGNWPICGCGNWNWFGKSVQGGGWGTENCGGYGWSEKRGPDLTVLLSISNSGGNMWELAARLWPSCPWTEFWM